MVESRNPENMGLTVELNCQLSDFGQAASCLSRTLFFLL